MRSIHRITALAVTTLLLGAWTSSFNTRANRTQSGDACALLAQADWSAALGVAVDPGAPIIAANPRICGWAPPGGPKIDGKKLTVTLMTMKSFEAGKTPLKGITKEPLSGVGEDAIYITTSGLGTALNVRKGQSAFQVRVGGFKERQEKDIEKALALKILAKM